MQGKDVVCRIDDSVVMEQLLCNDHDLDLEEDFVYSARSYKEAN